MDEIVYRRYGESTGDKEIRDMGRGWGNGDHIGDIGKIIGERMV